MARSEPEPPTGAAPTPGRVARLVKKIWWLHSFVALGFGVGVMLTDWL